MGSISSSKRGKKTYYYYKESFRVKLNPGDSGIAKGSGRSRVTSRAVYLGTAEEIRDTVKHGRRPKSVNLKNFGLLAAAYQTAQAIGLPQILKEHIPGSRYGVPRWIYFFITILNRLDHATSKNGMERWLKKTILPELLGVSPKAFTSKTFWYAADDVISERELQEAREQNGEEDIFVGLDDSVFTNIEMDLFRSIDKLMDLSPHVICYDTTNLYTYIEEPKRSALATTCHSKAGKHFLRHVGLLMAVEKQHGVPLTSRVYRASTHDSKVFSFMVSDLVTTIKTLCGSDSEIVLVLDKGNNSPGAMTAMPSSIGWIGSLTPSHYPDLLEKDPSTYDGLWKGVPYHRCRRDVYGIDCVLVLTYNDVTRRKKMHSLSRGIAKLKKELLAKWQGYKTPKCKVTDGIKSLLKQSRYGTCVTLDVLDGKLVVGDNGQEIDKRKKRFGKNIVFSNVTDAETGFLIDAYRDKNVIESDFQLLKDPAIIRFRPVRHWTDSKIRAYAFCCVASMTLMRVMQWMAERAGCAMSPGLLKEELSDLKEAVMVYSLTEARRQITHRSSVQEKLWDIFNLDPVAEKLLLHK